MTRVRPDPYRDELIVDLDDFVPHAPDETELPRPPIGRAGSLPELLLCLAAADLPADGLPERLRTLAELAYRMEEALLARGTPLRRALCSGTAALPFAAVTAPDAMPAFAPRGPQSQPLFQSLAQACALAESFPSDRPTCFTLLTDLPPDGLPQAVLRGMLGRMQRSRPCLRAALVYCGREQTVWTARLREIQHILRPILPGDSDQMYDFLFEGGGR